MHYGNLIEFRRVCSFRTIYNRKSSFDHVKGFPRFTKLREGKELTIILQVSVYRYLKKFTVWEKRPYKTRIRDCALPHCGGAEASFIA